MQKRQLARMKGEKMATKTVVRYRKAPRARRHSRAGMTVPVAVLAGFAPLIMAGLEGYQYNGFSGVTKRLSLGLTGYNTEDHKWYPMEVVRTSGPIVAGILVHKLAGRLGINRALGRAKIPFLRI
jgi:hypothetical protein